MSQTVTLRLPDTLYRPVQRMAKAIKRPMEDVLVTALHASLPSLEGLDLEMTAELEKLDSLSIEALEQVMLDRAPAAQQRELERLLEKNQSGILSDREQERVQELQREADRLMLRKARGAVLLKFRGHRLPTFEELHRQGEHRD